MITVEEFKKLCALPKNHTVYCDDQPVTVFYDWDENYKELATDTPELYACTFTFHDDHYGSVFTLLDDDYKNCKWTVKKWEEVDWRK